MAEPDDLGLSGHRKVRVEQAAGEAALSVNAWLIRAANAALGSADQIRRAERRSNQLQSTDGPDATDETVDVLARTNYGDIVVRRA